jgi:lysyl-tRNA synthetase class 2
MADVPDRPAKEFLPSAPLEHLRFRACLLRRLREFFDQRGFFEVSTPVMASETVVDAHLDPFRVICPIDPRCPDQGPVAYLQTSPEIHMKRLLVAGAEAIYQIGPALRCAESGASHNTEFTIAEWYRCGDNLEGGMRVLAELAEQLLDRKPTDFLSYAELFQRYLQVDPHGVDTASLRKLVDSHGQWKRVDSASRDELLEFLMSQSIQPHLGGENPTIVYDYPASQAALARVRAGPPAVAERFELFYRGAELANGYHELTDPDELQTRFHQANRLRTANGRQALPMPDRFIDAMRHGLPPCAGAALGFDRLVMAALGIDDIAMVIPFKADRA